MPEFLNPFSGVVPRTMTQAELIRAIMQNIAAELEAVHLYTSHMDATDDPAAKAVLHDIALEEMVHAGEFTSLLYRLDPIAAAKAQEGFAEVEDLLGSQSPAEVAADEGAQEPSPEASAADQLTVGSLKEPH